MPNCYQIAIEQADIEEKELKPTLEKYFNTKLLNTKFNSLFDYISEDKNMYIELKSRTNKKDKYPTTMIGFNKIIKADELLKDNKKIKLVFKFTDGLYYYEYTTNSKDECSVKIGGRNDRGKPEYKQYLYIPVNLLIKIII